MIQNSRTTCRIGVSLQLAQAASSLGGKTPNDRLAEFHRKTPFWDEVEAMFDPAKERIHMQNYALDSALKALKL